MTHLVTLELPDSVLLQAREIATRKQQRVEDVLTDWIERFASELPVDALSDDEVLALADMRMPEKDQEMLSQLLERQRQGLLDTDEEEHLGGLLDIYRQGLVRKAQAIQVAAARGLQLSTV